MEPREPDLELYPPYAVISGIFAGDYTISSYPAPTVPQGGSTTMDVVFTPGAQGVRPATIMIPCSDPDEPTYTINLNGIPVIPLRMVHGGSGTTSVYNQVTNTFSTSALTMTGTIGAGAHAFKIPAAAPMPGSTW